MPTIIKSSKTFFIAMKTGVSVADAMTQEPITISPNLPLEACAVLMKEHNIGSLIIREKDKLKGILTEWDIVRKVVATGGNPKKLTAKDVMESNVVTISPNQDIYEALVKMRNNDIRHMPVVKAGVLVGYLTIKDVLKIQPELFEILVEKMEAGCSLKGL
jgi:CBS domain-containing protein